MSKQLKIPFDRTYISFFDISPGNVCIAGPATPTAATMPMFAIHTNVCKDAVPDSLLGDLTQQLAKATGKPAQYIAVHIIPDQMMSFGGSTDPCALCSLYSIGKIGGQQNKTYTKMLCDLISKHLHVSADRVYINYFDMNAANVGWNGSTFA
ncbi:Macrophage migration inhibitory factor [Lonchura striata]|uniref:Macrophage migration inhibitory factor n=3 Tax=Passeriformes TaxID=9126 RepID=A0A218V3G4_9PASE|nr:Macrophage migration inhibitory factor [Lonchura striata domestica]